MYFLAKSDFVPCFTGDPIFSITLFPSQNFIASSLRRSTLNFGLLVHEVFSLCLACYVRFPVASYISSVCLQLLLIVLYLVQGAVVWESPCRFVDILIRTFLCCVGSRAVMILLFIGFHSSMELRICLLTRIPTPLSCFSFHFLSNVLLFLSNVFP